MPLGVPLANPQPKQRFQESADNISKHRDLVDSREFQRGADFAMLQYTGRLTQQITDFNSAAAAGLKMAGAWEFLNTYRMLSENLPTPTPAAQQNLDHRS